MAENKAAEAQEQLKNEKVYKITSKGFESRKEAAGEAAEAKIKGFMPVIIIEGSTYKVLYAEETNKTAAEKILKAVKEKKLDAVINAAE